MSGRMLRAAACQRKKDKLRCVIPVGKFEIIKNCQTEEDNEKADYYYTKKKINKIIQRDIEFHVVHENKPTVGLNDPYHMNGHTQDIRVCKHCTNLTQDKKLCRCKYAMINTNYSRMAHYDVKTPSSDLWNCQYNIASCLFWNNCAVDIDNWFQQQHMQKLIERTQVCLNCHSILTLTHYFCRAVRRQYINLYRRQQRRARQIEARQNRLNQLRQQREARQNRVLSGGIDRMAHRLTLSVGEERVVPAKLAKVEVSLFYVRILCWHGNSWVDCVFSPGSYG